MNCEISLAFIGIYLLYPINKIRFVKWLIEDNVLEYLILILNDIISINNWFFFLSKQIELKQLVIALAISKHRITLSNIILLLIVFFIWHFTLLISDLIRNTIHITSLIVLHLIFIICILLALWSFSFIYLAIFCLNFIFFFSFCYYIWNILAILIVVWLIGSFINVIISILNYIWLFV